MFQPGNLDQRISIQVRDLVVDQVGQPIEVWLPVAELWANIKHLSGAESIRGDAPLSTLRASIRIRWRAGLDAGMRVLHGATVYEIKALVPQGREWIDLVCEAWNAAT